MSVNTGLRKVIKHHHGVVMAAIQSLSENPTLVNRELSSNLEPRGSYCGKVRVRKCSCGHNWCPICWERRGNREFNRRLGQMRWDRVRHVVVTVARGKFRDGREAYEALERHRAVSELVKDLERTEHITVVRWIAHLEWHSDGFPHWHIFIEVANGGPGGRIGGTVLRAHWPWGLNVHEDYFKSVEHWRSMRGYFERHGYFDKDKCHQNRLPEWARRSTRKIPRWSGSRNELPYVDRDEQEAWGKLVGQEFIARMRHDKRCREDACSDMGGNGSESGAGVRVTNGDTIDSCGMRSKIGVMSRVNFTEATYDIPYQVLKRSFPWEYVEREGLVLNLGEGDLSEFLRRLSLLTDGEAPTLPTLNKGTGASDRTAEASAPPYEKQQQFPELGTLKGAGDDRQEAGDTQGVA